MDERAKIVAKIAQEIERFNPGYGELEGWDSKIGRSFNNLKNSVSYLDNQQYDRICTCGQNGYPVNHPNSNHPHAEDCPQSKDVGSS